jgi:DNA-binding MarR family transcriptional regulator
MSETSKFSEQAATELLMASNLLVRRLRLEGSGLESLTWTQVAVMHRLETEPMTIADLARIESIKPQSMGATVAILEEGGFVERKPHPSDGRQFLFALTASGEEMRRASTAAKRAWLARAIEGLGPDDRAALFAAINVLRELSEK